MIYDPHDVQMHSVEQGVGEHTGFGTRRVKGEQIPCCQDQHEGAGILASQNKPHSVPVPASRNASTVYLRRLALPGSWQLALKPPISLQVRHCQAARLSKSLVCLRLPRMPRKPDNAGCVSAVQEVMQTLRGHGAGRPSISKDVGAGRPSISKDVGRGQRVVSQRQRVVSL